MMTRRARGDIIIGMNDNSGWTVVFLDADTLTRGDVSFERIERRRRCVFYPHTSAAELPARLEGCSAAVTNKVVIGASDMDLPQAANLKLIAIAATGTNNVDLAAASARGIPVCNVAGYSTGSVVQHTFAMILELATRVGAYAGDVRGGRWHESPVFTMLTRPVVEIGGMTLGIVGYGAIGGAVAEAAKAFGMKVLIAARPGAEGPPPEGRVPLEELLARADIVTLHCPLTPQTKGLIGERELGMMKPSAFLINVARGGIVDERALADALRAGKIAGAAADVLTSEPPGRDNPLAAAAAELDNLIITPHTAWTSRQARQRLIDEIAENIAAFASGGERNRVA